MVLEILYVGAKLTHKQTQKDDGVMTGIIRDERRLALLSLLSFLLRSIDQSHYRRQAVHSFGIVNYIPSFQLLIPENENTKL
jgi:hypothetical protein